MKSINRVRVGVIDVFDTSAGMSFTIGATTVYNIRIRRMCMG
jgi:hypothetical protein